jgi:hypothetical protein
LQRRGVGLLGLGHEFGDLKLDAIWVSNYRDLKRFEFGTWRTPYRNVNGLVWFED